MTLGLVAQQKQRKRKKTQKKNEKEEKQLLSFYLLQYTTAQRTAIANPPTTDAKKISGTVSAISFCKCKIMSNCAS